MKSAEIGRSSYFERRRGTRKVLSIQINLGKLLWQPRKRFSPVPHHALFHLKEKRLVLYSSELARIIMQGFQSICFLLSQVKKVPVSESQENITGAAVLDHDGYEDKENNSGASTVSLFGDEDEVSSLNYTLSFSLCFYLFG